MVDFVGPGAPLSAAGITAALAHIPGVATESLWSVLSVETSGSGYLADRRPKILFEKTYFSRLTHGQYDASHPDISGPHSPGEYGAGGANQYLRLAAAIALDSDAALQSASWGLGQIMGANFAAAGFGSAEDMVTAFVASEDGQLGGMTSFIKSTPGMAPALADLDWVGFASRYNGPSYAKNNYDGLLARFHQQYVTGPMPDLRVRAAQTYLRYHGYAISVDGVAGPHTTDAVTAFQTSQGVPATGVIDDALIALLSA